MNPTPAPAHSQPRRTPLAAGLALALATCGLALASAAPGFASAPDRPAATLPVTSCADDGDPGTLRKVMETAASGDIIDLSALTCSTISLTRGAISTTVDDLTLRGPASALTIDGDEMGPIFEHYGTGTFAVEDLTLANGSYPGGGACVFSEANVVLTRTTVRNCAATESAGGGVLAMGDLTLEASTLTGNSAIAGGAAAADGAILVLNSTISGNTASAIGGGLYNGGAALGGATVTIVNSTITGNDAGFAGGGTYLGYDAPMTLQSTIVAGNTAPTGYGADVGGSSPLTVSGANNLVMDATFTLPADTLAADPLLRPLADNGGPTPTHALDVGSPAIDVGNNDAALAFDQRGTGYARTVGSGTDIGAFEVQGDADTIFIDGFDG